MTFDDLSREEKFAFWTRIEGAIRDLLHTLDAVVSEQDKTIIRDYLKYNELGLALDHVKYVLTEEDIAISHAIVTEIAGLMGQMNYMHDDIEQFKGSVRIEHE